MRQNRQSHRPQTLASIGRQLTRVSKNEAAEPQLVDELLWAAASVDADRSEIGRFMVRHLVPRCVAAAPAEGHGQARSSQLRRLMAGWINGLPEESLWAVRRVVMQSVIHSLRSTPTVEGMYSLASIGYRSPEAIDVLADLGRRDDRVGHEAMRLLLGLEPATDVRAWIAKRIRGTPFERRTDELLNAAAQFHDTSFLPFLADDAIRREPSWLALPRLLWVGQESPGDSRVQDAVWRAVARVSRSWQDGRDHLATTGGLIKSCHSPRALRAMLRAAVTAGRGPTGLLTQVAEAESPMQLRGWVGAPVGKLVSSVRRFVESDTGNTGVGQTSESLNKNIALEALLSSGSPRTTEIVGIAIANETNVYMTAELMRALAMFPLSELPPRVTKALREESGFTNRTDENTRLVVYLAAARVATSCRSFRGVDALAKSRGLVNGHPLTVPVRGAVAQLLWLARSQRMEAVKRVIDGLNDESPLPQIVAAQALQTLLQTERIDEAMPRLVDLATNRDARPYVRTAAIAAVAVANRQQVDVEWHDALVRLCEDPDATVQYAAASALIAAGKGQEANGAVERLARSGGDAARLHALLVGQLVAVEPDRHIETARAIMTSSDGELVHAFLDGFRAVSQLEQEAGSLPTVIADAAVARIVRDESDVRSDAPLLERLANLSPARVLNEAWSAVWDQWMPQSRCALAEALPEAVQDQPNLRQPAVDLLERLVQDGSFAVRRSAARSLSRVSEATLVEWCEDAYRSGAIHLRRLAVEAAAWLPIDSETSLDNAVVRKGRVDAERTVRDAADRAARDMRRRSWAQSLLAEMTVGASDDEGHIHKQYRTSKALARVGDDEDLRALNRLRRDPAFPPNVAYWFERTRDELEKQWKKTTAEWPEPWRHWDAAIERVKGTLSVGGQDHVVALHLWHRRGRGAEGISGWGAAGQVESAGHTLHLAQTRDDVTLTVEGRQPARALIASLKHKLGAGGAEIVLTGNGPYPAGHPE